MAGTSRFHDKLHRSNHHSVSTVGLIDSAYDPIASKESPFRGDFVLSGALSALGDSTVNAAVVRNNLTVQNYSLLNGPVYTDWETGGVATHNQAGATNKSGAFTLTLNYNRGVYINGTGSSAAKLVLGNPGALLDGGTISVTNVDATSARLTTLTVSSAVGIGTNNPQHTLHVVGDVIIYGTLTANGNSYFQNTLFSTTSSLSIINTGTGAGLTVSQEGNQPIVAFYDHESSISLWADGDAARPGWVGVKTHTPNVEFTVYGDASASGTVYGSQSDSNRWSSVYNTTTATSARWESVYLTTNATSASWSLGYTTTTLNSANWNDTYTAVNSNSVSWTSTYTTVNVNSAKWNNTYTAVSPNSANWNNTYTAVNPNSAKWNANYTSSSTKSAAWDAVYASVNASSASWNAGGGSAGDTYLVLTSNSANWNNTYTAVNSNSAKWNANYTTSSTKSASWESNYSTVVSNSAAWGSGGTASTTVTNNSANWQAGYTTTSTNSSKWDSSYTTLCAGSALWQSTATTLTGINLDYLADVSITSNTLADGQLLTYDIGTQQWENTSLLLSGFVQGHTVWESTFSTTNSNSANWNTGFTAYTTITANSANWNTGFTAYTTITANSANWDTGFTAYTTITANSATWNTNSLSGSTDVAISSPANNALLQYSTAQGKWINSDTIVTTSVLTAGSINLTTAEVSTFETELSASGDFLLININGTIRKLRLWD